jgi:hypothetical protein
VPLERSDNLALVVIAALEGAIILARIRRDLTPFDAIVVELGPLLDAVARPRRRGKRGDQPAAHTDFVANSRQDRWAAGPRIV